MKFKYLLLTLASVLCAQTAEATTRTVTNLLNQGAGSLRDTIAASASGDTINFSVSGTITLTNGQLNLVSNLTIGGPGANLLTISGNHSNRVFAVGTSATVTLSGLTVANGKANPYGGGIYSSGTLSVNDCIISGNSTDGNGGGIYNGGTLTLNNCSLSGNTAYDGGGLFDESGTLTANNCTFSGNQCQFDGGGIFGETDTVILNNCTVFSNSAPQYGGGIYAYLETLTLTNCTVSSNSAFGAGGVINNGGNFKSINTIIAGNIDGGAYPDVYGAVNSQGHNFIGKTNFSSGWIASDWVGSVALPLNPLLGPLKDNGGPTFTMALLPGSQAIDAGADSITNSLTTDQRGRPRKSSAHVDIGAYELILPLLSIALSADNVVLSWSTNDSGFTLEARTDLSSATWSNAPGNLTIVGSQYSVTNSATSGNQFYRLRSP